MHAGIIAGGVVSVAGTAVVLIAGTTVVKLEGQKYVFNLVFNQLLCSDHKSGHDRYMYMLGDPNSQTLQQSCDQSNQKIRGP
jgi:hypothetical protein